MQFNKEFSPNQFEVLHDKCVIVVLQYGVFC